MPIATYTHLDCISFWDWIVLDNKQICMSTQSLCFDLAGNVSETCQFLYGTVAGVRLELVINESATDSFCYCMIERNST